jgi:hypothetical protein
MLGLDYMLTASAVYSMSGDLANLTPAITMAGGRATYDPDKRLAR